MPGRGADGATRGSKVQPGDPAEAEDPAAASFARILAGAAVLSLILLAALRPQREWFQDAARESEAASA